MVIRSVPVALAVCVAFCLLAAPARGDGTQTIQQQHAAARRALDWLIKVSGTPQWQKSNLGNGNEVAKKQVVDLLNAWLLIVHEDADSFDDVRKDRLARADRTTSQRGMAKSAFANWLDGFAGLYSYERSLRDGKPHAALAKAVQGFVDRQNPEGGWAHSGGSPAGFYPTTLNAVGNFALLSLGAAERLELKVAESYDYEDTVDEALALYRDVQGPNGAFPYGGRVYRKGFESGRTAGALLGLAALKKTDSELFKRAVAHVRQHVASVPYGHASTAMHVGLGGLSFRMLGEEPWAAYRQQVLTKVLLAQAEDGSFGDIVGTFSSDSMGMEASDVSTAYRTALYAVALSADRSRIVQTLAKDVTLAPPSSPVPPDSKKYEPRISLPLAGAVQAVADEDNGIALTAAGDCYAIDMQKGKLLGKLPVGLTSETVRRATLFLYGERLLIYIDPKVPEPAPLRDAALNSREPEPAKGYTASLSCFDIGTGKRQWQIDIASLLRMGMIEQEYFSAALVNDQLVKYSLLNGAVETEIPLVDATVNFACIPLANDRYFSAGESRLALLDQRGDAIWTKRNRAPRGVNPAAFNSLARRGSVLFAGSSDGVVQALAVDDGSRRWTVELGAVVLRLLDSDNSDMLIAVCGDGRIHGLRGGEAVWTVDLARGREMVRGHEVDRRLPALLTTAGLWVYSEADQRLVLFNPATGKATGYIPSEGVWSAHNRSVLVATDHELRLYRVTDKLTSRH